MGDDEGRVYLCHVSTYEYAFLTSSSPRPTPPCILDWQAISAPGLPKLQLRSMRQATRLRRRKPRRLDPRPVPPVKARERAAVSSDCRPQADPRHPGLLPGWDFACL